LEDLESEKEEEVEIQDSHKIEDSGCKNEEFYDEKVESIIVIKV
jgi:hypothetical protein